jgi:RNA polymerase subunit RPABC4/transcription elongation factor Spt4
MAREDAHVCPWCGSADTVHVQRGFVGPTDDRNQYLVCNSCSRLTFEIISKTVRDMRVGQFRVGGTYRDPMRQTKYTITRVLKVGMNECLLYVKPVIRSEPDPPRNPD